MLKFRGILKTEERAVLIVKRGVEDTLTYCGLVNGLGVTQDKQPVPTLTCTVNLEKKGQYSGES